MKLEVDNTKGTKKSSSNTTKIADYVVTWLCVVILCGMVTQEIINNTWRDFWKE